MTNHKKSRPHLPEHILQGIATQAEDFQNKVLRPTIKMQSELLLAHLNAKLVALKVDLKKLDLVKQRETLTDLLTKNQSFKQEVIGMIIGQFDLDEYQTYSIMSKEINRRITQIVLNRCLDQLVR
jgi:hypothetical protein